MQISSEVIAFVTVAVVLGFLMGPWSWPILIVVVLASLWYRQRSAEQDRDEPQTK